MQMWSRGQYSGVQYSGVQYSTVLILMGLCNRKEDNIHEIFYRGAPWQFYRGLFGRSRGERSDPRLCLFVLKLLNL